MGSPLFSIVVTSFNQREFIGDAVDSAVALEGSDCEVIVVDDGSTDGSGQLLQRYRERVRLVLLPRNLGKGAARNAGVDIARGDYLIFLDGDDALQAWSIDVYQRIVEAMHPKVVLATMRWFEGRLPEQRHPGCARIEFVEYEDYLNKDRGFDVSASSVIIERETFNRVHGWHNMPVMQDQDLMIRLGTEGPTVHILSPSTTWHRAHPRQTIRNVPPFIEVVGELVQRERQGEFPGGPERRFDRAALLGGLTVFWTRRALAADLYAKGLRLILVAWPYVLAAIARRVLVRLGGHRPSERLDLSRPRHV
jgi:glycosyltransferase involved in cell wall biosynthesis